MNYILEHKKIYDLLADEYEGRVEVLVSVTHKAISLFKQSLSGKNVLELGCGVGLAVELLRKQGFNVIGIDVSLRMLQFARRRNPRTQLINGDFLKMHFEKPFDGVFAFAFIHLFPKKEAFMVLSKIYTILKPGGALYIGTTKDARSREGWEVKEDYLVTKKRFRKHWTVREFTATLKETGFTVVKAVECKDPFGKLWMDFLLQKPK